MKVSVVVPAYNEEGNIIPTVERIVSCFRKENLDGDIILVDDGSRDATFAEMQEAARWYDCVRIFRHTRNRGLSYALNTGFANITGDVAIFLPADLQFDPEEAIPRLTAKIAEGYDAAAGYKEGPEVVLRGLASRLSNFIIRLVFGLSIQNMNAVRAFRRETIEGLRLRSEWHSLTLPLVAAQGYRIGQVPVTVCPRSRGESKFRLRSFVYAFFDLITVRLLITFSRRPLLLFGSVSLVLSLLAVVAGGRAVVDYLVAGVGIFRPLLLGAGVLALGAVFMLLTGFLAELIVNVQEALDVQNERLQAIEVKLTTEEIE